MLRIRLSRTGAKKRPSYRIVVAESRFPRDGRHVEILGFYDPMTKPSTVRIDTERAVQWLQNGAQPTDRARIVLRHAGVLKAHDDARMADKRRHKDEQAAGIVEKAQRVAARAASRAAAAEAAVATGAANAAAGIADEVTPAKPARSTRAARPATAAKVAAPKAATTAKTSTAAKAAKSAGASRAARSKKGK